MVWTKLPRHEPDEKSGRATLQTFWEEHRMQNPNGKPITEETITQQNKDIPPRVPQATQLHKCKNQFQCTQM